MDYTALEAFIDGWAMIFNALYSVSIELLTLDYNSILGTGGLSAIMPIIKSTALNLVIVFFLMDFMRKTMDFEWVKWENVLLFFIKLFIAKQLIDNSETFMGYISAIFGGLAKNISGAAGGTFLTEVPGYGYAGNFINTAEIDTLRNSKGLLAFVPVIVEQITLLPIMLIIAGALVVTMCMAIRRLFELLIYTVSAPIPLSTFASEGFSDVGKGFLKAYIAVCLQGFIIIVMFMAYAALNTYFNGKEFFSFANWVQTMVLAITLAVSVVKSGSWAKKLTGAI